MNEIVTQAWSRYAPPSAAVIDAPEQADAADAIGSDTAVDESQPVSALLIPGPRSQPDDERRRRGLRLHRVNS